MKENIKDEEENKSSSKQKKIERIRLNAYVIPEAFEYIEQEANKYGMSRGAFLSYLVIQRKEQAELMNTMQSLQNEMSEMQKKEMVEIDGNN